MSTLKVVNKSFRATPVVELPDTVVLCIRVPNELAPRLLAKKEEWRALHWFSGLGPDYSKSVLVKVDPSSLNHKKIYFRVTRDLIPILRARGRNREPSCFKLTTGNYEI